MATSQNGYIANRRSRTRLYRIPGTDRRVRLRKGAPGRLLVMFAAWFHDSIEPIDVGQLDDWGYAARAIRGSDTISNHASGTAIDLNALRHPMGVRGTFTRPQEDRIRHWLDEHNRCVRWGGDYVHRPDEMHFEIVRDVRTCRAALHM